MNAKVRWSIAAVVLILGVLIARAQVQRDAATDPAHKLVKITRIYSGADGLSHAEEIEVPFGADGAYDFLAIKGAVMHRSGVSATPNWHVDPRPQYVITVAGSAEIELAGGQKIPVGPGSIDLFEDTTGKGHIMRNFEERVDIQLPLTNPPAGQ
jgi:hypothetical protein